MGGEETPDAITGRDEASLDRSAKDYAKRHGVVPLLGLLSDAELVELWTDLVARARSHTQRATLGTTWAKMARQRLGTLALSRDPAELDAELELILRSYNPPPPT